MAANHFGPGLNFMGGRTTKKMESTALIGTLCKCQCCDGKRSRNFETWHGDIWVDKPENLEPPGASKIFGLAEAAPYPLDKREHLYLA